MATIMCCVRDGQKNSLTVFSVNLDREKCSSPNVELQLHPNAITYLMWISYEIGKMDDFKRLHYHFVLISSSD